MKWGETLAIVSARPLTLLTVNALETGVAAA
jgi:hypothetical protein